MLLDPLTSARSFSAFSISSSAFSGSPCSFWAGRFSAFLFSRWYLPGFPVSSTEATAGILETPGDLVQPTLSKADTLGNKATVCFREVSALERVYVTWYPNLQIEKRACSRGLLAVHNDHMTDRLCLY